MATLTGIMTLLAAFASGPQQWPKAVDGVLSSAHERTIRRASDLDAAAERIVDLKPDVDLRREVRQFGLTDGLVLPMVVVQPDHPRLSGVWQRYLREHVIPQGFTHYGVAVRSDRFSLVFARRLLNLQAPTGLIRAGQHIRIKGTLRESLRGVSVLVGRPDERVDEGRVVVHGKRVRIDLALDGGDGLYMAEVMGQGSRGTEVVALIPITVGRHFEKSNFLPTYSSQQVSDPHTTPSKQLLGLINQDRARLGLAPLRLSRTLSQTAQSHARVLAGEGFAAHVVSGGDAPIERLAKADVTTPVFHENVALAPNILQVHKDLWASPSHRRALLDDKINAVGLGVEVVDTGSGSLYFVVEHLAKL